MQSTNARNVGVQKEEKRILFVVEGVRCCNKLASFSCRAVGLYGT